MSSIIVYFKYQHYFFKCSECSECSVLFACLLACLFVVVVDDDDDDDVVVVVVVVWLCTCDIVRRPRVGL